MIRNFLILLVLAISAIAQTGRQDADYEKGLRALDARQWDQAIAAFNECARRKVAMADGALYWKAYAEMRSGSPERAFQAISLLRSDFPDSKWVKDAQALEVEMRGQAGAPVSPGAQSDEELKLLAINSLMQSDPDQALPILQKLLASNNSEKVKERALFVLTQNSSPEAKKILAGMARNSSDPALQMKAIRDMGLMGGADSRKDLASIYNSSSDVRLKRAILQSFMQSGSRDFSIECGEDGKESGAAAGCDPAARFERRAGRVVAVVSIFVAGRQEIDFAIDVSGRQFGAPGGGCENRERSRAACRGYQVAGIDGRSRTRRRSGFDLPDGSESEGARCGAELAVSAAERESAGAVGAE